MPSVDSPSCKLPAKAENFTQPQPIRLMLKHALVLTALLSTTAAAQTDKSPSPTAEVRAAWKGVIVNITAAADELPESLYSYKPTPDVRSFGELFAHIAGSQKMYCAMALGDKVP